MNTVNISQKAKNKHLNFSHYEFIDYSQATAPPIA